METVQLDKIKLAALTYLDSRGLRLMDAKVADSLHSSFVGNGLAVRLSGKIFGAATERLCVNEKRPRDWWQAFRERWFPRRWLRRHPVIYDEIYIDRQLYGGVCPHVALEGTDKHLQWLATTSEGPTEHRLKWGDASSDYR